MSEQVSYNTTILKKVSPNPTPSMLADAINRLVDYAMKNSIMQGENILISKTPHGVIINAKQPPPQIVEGEAPTGDDLRFS